LIADGIEILRAADFSILPASGMGRFVERYLVICFGHGYPEAVAAFAFCPVERKIHGMQQMLKRFWPPIGALKKTEAHGYGDRAFRRVYRAA
jgi:hypothetical protein